MKKWVKAFLFLTLLFSLSFNVMAGGAEDMPEPNATEEELVEQGFPIVSGIYDAAEDGPIVMPVATDQMGKYVSVYVRGRNINKDTVKPVFYDENGNVISGEVAAVEVSNDRWYGGAFFRIEKKSSPAWQIENTAACNTKNYKVKLESLCGKAILDGNNNYAVYGDKAASVEIYRRDVFYTSFNEHQETLTLYFSSDVKLDEIKKLELGWFDYNSDTREYIMNVVKTVEQAEITTEVNKLTGHQEQRAKFSLKGFDYNNAFGNWSPDFRVTFKNGNTTEVYDTSYPSDSISQILGRVSFFQSAYKTGSVSGGYDVVLYYPYWIGGVYKFADTGNDYKYYLTKDEVDDLKEVRFSYAKYNKGDGRLDTGSFNDNRRYSFCYFELEERPEKPSQIPVVSATVDDEDMVTLTWKKLSGVTGYRVYAVSEQGFKVCVVDTKETTCTFSKMVLQEMSEAGYEGTEIKVCAYVEKNGFTVEGDFSKAVSLDKPNIPAPKKVSLSKLSYTYNGKERKPDVTVRDVDGKKISKSCYTLKYSNNINAGKAKVVVTFKGNYAGFDSITRTFTINKAKASIVKLSGTAYEYSGKKITPRFVTSSGASVPKSDYTITSIKNNKNVGKATVKVKFKGNYKSASRTFTFEIVPEATNLTSLKASEKAFTAKWEAQKKQTSGYQLQYSTYKSFKKPTSKYYSTKTTSKKITGLKSSKTYYVRVRAYKTVSGKKYYSTWSQTLKVKTK